MRGSVHCEASQPKTGMQRIHIIVRKDAGAWALLLTVLILCLCAAIAGAQSVPNVVMSQVTLMAGFKSGGADRRCSSGSSMAVDANGNVIVSATYGKAILEFTPGATSPTTLGSFKNFNPGGVALDPAGNLYLSNTYNGTIVKIPVSNGTYAAIPEPDGTQPACKGNDTAEWERKLLRCDLFQLGWGRRGYSGGDRKPRGYLGSRGDAIHDDEHHDDSE